MPLPIVRSLRLVEVGQSILFQRAGDLVLLNIVGARYDPTAAKAPIKAFQQIALLIAVDTVNRQCFACDFLEYFGRVELRNRGLHSARQFASFAGRRCDLVGHCPRHLDFFGHIGELLCNTLKVLNRLAELSALLSILDRLVEGTRYGVACLFLIERFGLFIETLQAAHDDILFRMWMSSM